MVAARARRDNVQRAMASVTRLSDWSQRLESCLADLAATEGVEGAGDGLSAMTGEVHDELDGLGLLTGVERHRDLAPSLLVG